MINDRTGTPDHDPHPSPPSDLPQSVRSSSFPRSLKKGRLTRDLRKAPRPRWAGLVMPTRWSISPGRPLLSPPFTTWVVSPQVGCWLLRNGVPAAEFKRVLQGGGRTGCHENSCNNQPALPQENPAGPSAAGDAKRRRQRGQPRVPLRS
jgi:hypothetical protein